VNVAKQRNVESKVWGNRRRPADCLQVLLLGRQQALIKASTEYSRGALSDKNTGKRGKSPDVHQRREGRCDREGMGGVVLGFGVKMLINNICWQ
jgi:hypothetical protein